jgi:hypothetical protein
VTDFGDVSQAPAELVRRPEIHLTDAGDHCLQSSVRQRKLWDVRTGRERTTIGGDGVILIGAHDVRLDLRGHAISNDRALGYTLVKHYQHVPGRKHVHWFKRTHIRNGSLVSPGSKGIALRLIAAGMYGPEGFGTVAEVPQGAQPADIFLDTSHLIDGLKIEAGRRAILIDGKNNVIRNNRITVDAATAIVAQGPGIIIENNVIEVRNHLEALSEFDRSIDSKTPFAIRLIQADGAIVRNNEIRLLDREGRGGLPAAIDLVSTRGALVEGNVFGGMEAAVHADDQSSYREERNEMEPCRGKATRFLPPDETGQLKRLPAAVCR